MTTLEKLRHLRELAAKTTPRPWEVRREDSIGGYIDYQINNGGGGHHAACSELASDNARVDADYIAAAANLLPALVELAASALGWSEDTGECHFCDLGWPVYKPDLFHDDDCPVLLLERALEADHG
jgi:hypothetical protein